MVAKIQKKTFRDFDWLIAVIAIAIVCFGAWEIRNAVPTETFWQKQLIGLAIAFIAMLAIAFSDYRRLVDLAPFLYVFGLMLLIVVLVPGIGMKINGQRCWIKLPVVGNFQPSEFVTLPVVLMLAKYFGKHQHHRNLDEFRRLKLTDAGQLDPAALAVDLHTDAGN